MESNDEIIEKIWSGAEAKYTSRDMLLKLMDEARAEGSKEGRLAMKAKVVKILNDLWEKEGKNIDGGVYAYPFELLRHRIIKELDKR